MKFKKIKSGMAIHCPKEEDARALLEHLKEIGCRCWKDGSDITKEDEHYRYYCINGMRNGLFINWATYTTPPNCDITEFSDLIEPEPRFKVGDKVRVRSDLVLNGLYEGLLLLEDMAKLRGTSHIVTEATSNGNYCLSGDPKGFYWADKMLEPEPDIEFEVKDCGDAITSTIKEHGKITSELSEPKKLSKVEILEWLNDYVRDKNSEKLSEVFDVTTLESLFCAFTVDEIVQKITAYEEAKKKKPIELEWVKVVRIIQKEHDAERCVYEEELPTNAKKIPTEGILRKYMAEHEGNYFAVVVSRCRAKEDE